jgi:hypothetical protein
MHSVPSLSTDETINTDTALPTLLPPPIHPPSAAFPPPRRNPHLVRWPRCHILVLRRIRWEGEPVGEVRSTHNKLSLLGGSRLRMCRRPRWRPRRSCSSHAAPAIAESRCLASHLPRPDAAMLLYYGTPASCSGEDDDCRSAGGAKLLFGYLLDWIWSFEKFDIYYSFSRIIVPFHHTDDRPRSCRRLGSCRRRRGIVPANKNTSHATAASSSMENSFVRPSLLPTQNGSPIGSSCWRHLPSLQCPAKIHFWICLSLLKIALQDNPIL